MYRQFTVGDVVIAPSVSDEGDVTGVLSDLGNFILRVPDGRSWYGVACKKDGAKELPDDQLPADLDLFATTMRRELSVITIQNHRSRRERIRIGKPIAPQALRERLIRGGWFLPKNGTLIVNGVARNTKKQLRAGDVVEFRE